MGGGGGSVEERERQTKHTVIDTEKFLKVLLLSFSSNQINFVDNGLLNYVFMRIL